MQHAKAGVAQRGEPRRAAARIGDGHADVRTAQHERRARAGAPRAGIPAAAAAARVRRLRGGANLGDGEQPRGESSLLGGQRCTYLQSRFTTDPLTAGLYARLRQLVVKADELSGWRRVHAPTLVPRSMNRTMAAA